MDHITFTRSSVARILNCSVLTISNREKRGEYPSPLRGQNNYRYYTLDDIFHLQMLTYGKLYVRPLLAELWDKGFKDPVEADKLVTAAMQQYLDLHQEQTAS